MVIAIKNLMRIRKKTESIVHINVIFWRDLVVWQVTEQQMRNEKLYQVTMSFVHIMFLKGLISSEKYAEIDTIFLEKYQPILGSLFSEKDLIND